MEKTERKLKCYQRGCHLSVSSFKTTKNMCLASEFSLMFIAERPTPGGSRVHWKSYSSARLPKIWVKNSWSSNNRGTCTMLKKNILGKHVQMYVDCETMFKILQSEKLIRKQNRGVAFESFDNKQITSVKQNRKHCSPCLSNNKFYFSTCYLYNSTNSYHCTSGECRVLKL